MKASHLLFLLTEKSRVGERKKESKRLTFHSLSLSHDLKKDGPIHLARKRTGQGFYTFIMSKTAPFRLMKTHIDFISRMRISMRIRFSMIPFSITPNDDLLASGKNQPTQLRRCRLIRSDNSSNKLRQGQARSHRSLYYTIRFDKYMHVTV